MIKGYLTKSAERNILLDIWSMHGYEYPWVGTIHISVVELYFPDGPDGRRLNMHLGSGVARWKELVYLDCFIPLAGSWELK